MVTENKQAKFLKVKDRAGNVFLCPLDALKSVTDATEEELENCVEEAVAERYAGNFKVVK